MHICKCLDSHLDLSCIVQDPAGAIQEIFDRLFVEVVCSVGEDGIIPTLEIRVVLYKTRESSPLVSRRDKAWTVGTRGSRRWAGRFEGVFRPGESCVV
jgi:hypothetical protein